MLVCTTEKGLCRARWVGGRKPGTVTLLSKEVQTFSTIPAKGFQGLNTGGDLMCPLKSFICISSERTYSNPGRPRVLWEPGITSWGHSQTCRFHSLFQKFGRTEPAVPCFHPSLESTASESMNSCCLSPQTKHLPFGWRLTEGTPDFPTLFEPHLSDRHSLWPTWIRVCVMSLGCCPLSLSLPFPGLNSKHSLTNLAPSSALELICYGGMVCGRILWCSHRFPFRGLQCAANDSQPVFPRELPLAKVMHALCPRLPVCRD